MRQLASIQKILNLEPIEGADAIEKATVLGWELVVKKGEFKIGDLAIYCEIDSVLPEKPEFDFLRERKFRIKTVRLRGQISQGICFPLSFLPQTFTNNPENFQEGVDVTEILGVKKWEPPESPFANVNNHSFPPFIPKTDETRVQNLQKELSRYKGQTCYVAEKVDGTSITVFLNWEKHVPCELPSENNTIVEQNYLSDEMKESFSFYENLDPTTLSEEEDKDLIPSKKLMDEVKLFLNMFPRDINDLCYLSLDRSIRIASMSWKNFGYNVICGDLSEGFLWSVASAQKGDEFPTAYSAYRHIFHLMQTNPIEIQKFGVCSRNFELDEFDNLPKSRTPSSVSTTTTTTTTTTIGRSNVRGSPQHEYWKVVRDMKIEEKMKNFLLSQNQYKNLSLQGELIGPSIQKNKYELREKKIMFFSIYDIDKHEYVPYPEFVRIMQELELPTVPILDDKFILIDNIKELVKMAIGKSVLNAKTIREGLVIRTLEQVVDERNNKKVFSCKSINPEFLLKFDE